MGTTANHGFPYPEGTTDIDFDVHVKNLGDAIDSHLVNIDTSTISNYDSIQATQFSGTTFTGTSFSTTTAPQTDDNLTRKGYVDTNFFSKTSTSAQSVAGQATFNNSVTIDKGAQALTLKPGTNDHVYLAWNGDTQNPNDRTGYIGIPSSGSTTFSVSVERGNLALNATDTSPSMGNATVSAYRTLTLTGDIVSISGTNGIYANNKQIRSVAAGTASDDVATFGQIRQIYYFANSTYGANPGSLGQKVGDIAINTKTGEHWKYS